MRNRPQPPEHIVPSEPVPKTSSLPRTKWPSIGTVVGNTSTDRFTFILRSFQAKLGDIVATCIEVPDGTVGVTRKALVWGRIVSIDRFNPFFPAEAAQELADENIRFIDTVLSGSRDHLEAEVLILGETPEGEHERLQLSPLTYPVKPSGEVLYPAAEEVRRLLTGDEEEKSKRLRIGSLIARRDVAVTLSAKHIVSRHLAILAMTGGGKTVATRRILRELIAIGYPLVIFDPHGDYLGFFEQRDLLKNTEVQILYPSIRVSDDSLGTIEELVNKMGKRLTDPQQQFYQWLINTVQPRGESAADYIQKLIDLSDKVASKSKSKAAKHELADEIQETRASTMNAVSRSLRFVLMNLRQMEQNNERLRSHKRFKGYTFTPMPDPKDSPEKIVAPRMVSIFYLAGYDHLVQSAIVSVVLEALFNHRSTLSNLIPPFQAVIEEAHNFIPSRGEGTDDTPSLLTIRKLITEGRKFGTGLILVSQRPSRLDETTLAQCNSFLVLRLVNPKDKSFVRSVMENLSETDANILQSFGPGQGLVSGQAVRFPLLVQVDFDKDMVSQAIGDEDFLSEAESWRPDPKRAANSESAKRILGAPPKAPDRSPDSPAKAASPKNVAPVKKGRRARIKPEGF